MQPRKTYNEQSVLLDTRYYIIVQENIFKGVSVMQKNQNEYENVIYDIIYTLLGDNTPESDELLERMRQLPEFKWYVEHTLSAITGYVSILEKYGEL